jgi:hypothetical protein
VRFVRGGQLSPPTPLLAPGMQADAAKAFSAAVFG